MYMQRGLDSQAMDIWEVIKVFSERPDLYFLKQSTNEIHRPTCTEYVELKTWFNIVEARLKKNVELYRLYDKISKQIIMLTKY